ncbi:hypothetical protein CAPTEDRAFT_179377 [Capitella teleta]|uniref:Regulator of telomere elongation helicase 1 homolog n=1 Tax=Capitella teleta TaxID=283909 RepID=R7TPE7_CAPTE|nr:hypothetical protein CAPTEDRAFT_179377 [Capitella teleta]|eukprot:ELT95437.1 hypothetical protein CAPTEDRAFT_179377 [Capitella teleta]
MPLVEASGVSVNFPFDPYPCQVDYMSSVVSCLKTGQNAILESPTGTGKTLCLLCSSLAWLETKRAQITSQRWNIAQANADDGGEGSLNVGKQDLAGKLNEAAVLLAPPKIIYASRTHSQLTQVIQELKRSAYSHFKVSVLGSREQMCIHPQVMKEESNTVKVHMCRSKVTSRTCHFYNNMDTEFSADAKHNFTNQLMDIEDLVVQGKKMNCCPYYVARELKNDADIIFLPYNYLLDPKSRKAHGVELQGNIVIFDEAHNLEKMCEDSASFDFTSTDIASAMREVDSVAGRLQELCSDEVLSADFGTNSEQGGVDLELQDVLKVKMMLMNLESAIDEVPLPNPKEGITKPGSYIFDLLAKTLITFETKTQVLELLDKLVQCLSNEGFSTAFNSRGNAISKFADMIKIVFSKEPASDRTNLINHQQMAAQSYRVHIRQTPTDNFKSKSSGWGAAPTSAKTGRTLSYWCFSPSHTMLDLISRGVKSIILTSGTLSPISSFKSEMGIDFQIELENPHVIDPKQVWVGTLSKGPDNEPLCSDYNTRFKESYQKSLGNAVVNFSRIVPHGLLLFFPSYPVMDQCVTNWRSGTLWSRMDQMKSVYVEPRNKHEFNTTMAAYYDKINDDTCNGATFAAVCRGKVSEGLDFADRNGRAVVITGLPYPPRMDPKVMLKMKFLDETRRAGGKGLTGQEWYGQQATRAVNQAIGRVIRHKDDFGAIILCDRRFADQRAINQLPSWVRPKCQRYSQFGMAVRDMIAFFKEAERMVIFPVLIAAAVMPVLFIQMPQPRPSKHRMPAGCAGCEGAHFQPSFASLTDLKKSSSVLSEVPSLKKKGICHNVKLV